MNSRILGKDLEVSDIGLGCMGMSHGYGSAADKHEMTEFLAKAVDMGVSLFDTAEVYGDYKDPHSNEVLVGEALKPYRDKIKIVTKFGIKFDTSKPIPYPLVSDSRPETIRKSVEGSLKRLQTDHIDLYFQHRVDPKIPIEEVAGVMGDLIQEGKITHWGISEATEDVIRRAHKVCPLTAIENRYSMMARWHENLFPTLEELNIGFIAFSPLANGLLTDKYNKNSKFEKDTDYRNSMPQFSEENIDKNQELLNLIRKLANEKDTTPAQISLAWMISKKPWIVPIPGTRKLSRLAENIGASNIILSTKEVESIDKILDEIPMSEVFGGSKISK